MTGATFRPHVLGRLGTGSAARTMRRAAIGLAAGVLASAFLVSALGSVALGVALGASVGLSYGLATPHRPGTALEALMAAAALGVPLWALFSVLLVPLASVDHPMWTAAEMRALLPQFLGWVLYAATLGVVGAGASAALRRWLGPEPDPSPAAEPAARRVLILGGGFAGVATAVELERLLGADRSVRVTLVSETNALLFTPMLAEVAGSALEASHISTPLRGSLRRTEVVRGSVRAVDLAARRATVAGHVTVELPYDHLVLALGSVTNHFGLERVARYALGFKSLREAVRIRNQVIDSFERAALERDPTRRHELLTFVVAGAGFAGVELAGALNDFARSMLADHPSLSADDLAIVLLYPGERILPELSPSLAGYAQERLAARGVSFRPGARVADARPGAFILESGQEIRARTLVWTAGTAPHPLIRTLGLEISKRGSVLVDEALATARPGVWAAGDCAAVFDASSHEPCPPTAQCALREARTVARNVYATLRGRRARPFHFESLGALCVVGYQTACAELRLPFTRRHVRFSGLLAWMLWRLVYLSKLPGLERKVRVLVAWTFELFFPRDVVQTMDPAEIENAVDPERSSP